MENIPNRAPHLLFYLREMEEKNIHLTLEQHGV